MNNIIEYENIQIYFVVDGCRSRRRRSGSCRNGSRRPTRTPKPSTPPPSPTRTR